MTVATNPSAVISTPELWAAYILKIQDKTGAIVPFKYNDAQRDFIANRTTRDIIVKARQHGFSTLIQAELNRMALTGAAHTLTLADVDDNTQKLRRIAKRFHDHWPDGIARPLRGEDSAVITTYPEMHSSASIATAGSRSAGRAGTYHALHGSEVAFWPRPEETIAGALQAVPYDGWVVLESTPNGAQGWFYSTVMEALDGANNWRVAFYEWWWNDEYAIEPPEPLTYTPEEQHLVDTHGLSQAQIYWRRTKQRELKHLFAQEYPEDIRECFLLSGQSFFGDITGALGDTHYQRVDGHRYVGGVDFAQTVDWTVVSVGDVDTGQQVYIERMQKLPWAEMRRRILDVCERWNISRLLVEHNDAGRVNIEEMKRVAYERDMETTITSFKTTPKSKPPLITGLHEAIHSGALTLLDRPEVRREFQAFQASQTPSGSWKYAAPDGEHDDVVIATALMWRAMARPTAAFIQL